MKKVLFLLVSIMAFHGKIWAADAEDVQPKKVYKRPSNRPAPPTYAPPEPSSRGSVNVDSELDKLFSDLDKLESDAKKMNEVSEERKAVLDEAKVKAERVQAGLAALDNEVKGIRILESTAPRSARLSAVQEEALRREGSITSSEDAKRILNNEARKTANWGSKDLDITSEEDQKRLKEKYDREQKALDEVTRSNNSTIKLDKTADSKVEYKSIKYQMQSYEANKRAGNYTPSQRAAIESQHKNLKRDIKLYNQTARKRRALEKEQRKLESSLERRQAALDDFNALSDAEKKEEKRLAASLGLDDPEQEAKAKEWQDMAKQTAANCNK